MEAHDAGLEEHEVVVKLLEGQALSEHSEGQLW
jgi:hypothetical protein